MAGDVSPVAMFSVTRPDIEKPYPLGTGSNQPNPEALALASLKMLYVSKNSCAAQAQVVLLWPNRAIYPQTTASPAESELKAAHQEKATQ